MEAIYLNSFRIALPVAFPATRRPTRRPTRLPTLPFLRAYLLGAPCRFLGTEVSDVYRNIFDE